MPLEPNQEPLAMDLKDGHLDLARKAPGIHLAKRLRTEQTIHLQLGPTDLRTHVGQTKGPKTAGNVTRQSRNIPNQILEATMVRHHAREDISTKTMPQADLQTALGITNPTVQSITVRPTPINLHSNLHSNLSIMPSLPSLPSLPNLFNLFNPTLTLKDMPTLLKDILKATLRTPPPTHRPQATNLDTNPLLQ